MLEGEEVASSREATACAGVDRDIAVTGAPDRHESRYFVSGHLAEEVSPEQPRRWVGGPWGVEKGLHFIKDRCGGTRTGMGAPAPVWRSGWSGYGTRR